MTTAKNLPKLPIAYMAMKDKIKTNIKFSKLSQLALAFRSIDKSDINMVRLEGFVTYEDDVSYFEVSDESIEEIRSDYLYNFAY